MTAAMAIFGVLTIFSAIGVVLSAKPLNSALFLVLTLFLVAVHFALLDAHFLAALQVMVYAGAIMVLVIFVIMLLGVSKDETEQRSVVSLIAGILLSVCFMGVSIYSVLSMSWMDEAAIQLPTGFGNARAIGAVLFTKYLYLFEIASLLLLAGIIGAVVLAQDRKRALQPKRGLRAKQTLLAEEERQIGNY